MTTHAITPDEMEELGPTPGPAVVPIPLPRPPPRIPPQTPVTARRSPRVLQVRTAGFGRRLLAALVDSALVAAAALIVTALAAVVLGVPLPGPREFGPDFVIAGLLDRNPMAVGGIGLLFGIGAFYQVYLGGMLGQTVGKRLLRLRVISAHGTCPGLTTGLLRFAALTLSLLPAGLGWIWCLFDRERRTLHDHLCSTYVILEEG